MQWNFALDKMQQNLFPDKIQQKFALNKLQRIIVLDKIQQNFVLDKIQYLACPQPRQHLPTPYHPPPPPCWLTSYVNSPPGPTQYLVIIVYWGPIFLPPKL